MMPYRAFNADNKGGAIYWNDIKPFADENMELYDEIRRVQRFAQHFAENKNGKVVYPFEFSMWNVFVLKCEMVDFEVELSKYLSLGRKEVMHVSRQWTRFIRCTFPVLEGYLLCI